MENKNFSVAKQHLSVARLLYALLVILLVGTFMYVSTLLTSIDIVRITDSIGIFGPVGLVVAMVLSQVLAPLSGTPAIFVAIRLYGFMEAMFLLYLASMISAIVNFAVARRFGRPIVKRLVGERTMARVDSLSERSTWSLLIGARLGGYYFFDIVSYAVGLTSISFRPFLLSTAGATIVPMLIFGVLFGAADFSKLSVMVAYYAVVLSSGLIAAWWFAVSRHDDH